MSISDIEEAITQLPKDELAEFTEWFEAFLAEAWDKEIAQDLQDGRFDAILRQVEEEYEAAEHRPL